MRTIEALMDLHGRAALVTGGAGHIGQAVCATLAELGADVAVLDLNGERALEIAEELASSHHVQTHGLAVDLSDFENPADVTESVMSALGSLDILVNCAALVGTSNLEGWNAPFADQAIGPWRAALEINLTAVFRLTQACAPVLAASAKGVVVNIASIYGVVGPDPALYEGLDIHNPAAYAASKGALVQLTRWLATSLAPNVRVNAISPGGMKRGQSQAFIERYERRTPLGRMAREEDLKGAIAFLSTDLSSYVTGQNVLVDGGWTTW